MDSSELAAGIGWRIYVSGIVCAAMLFVSVLVQFVFPSSVAEGNPVAVIVLAVPMVPLAYCFYVGLAYGFDRRYRTRRLLKGVAIAVVASILYCGFGLLFLKSN